MKSMAAPRGIAIHFAFGRLVKTVSRSAFAMRVPNQMHEALCAESPRIGV
jgi:hypothetical protein